MHKPTNGLLFLAAFAATTFTACEKAVEILSDVTDCSFGDPRRGPFFTAPFGDQMTIRWDSEVPSGCQYVAVSTAAGKAFVNVVRQESEIQPYIVGGMVDDEALQDPNGTIYTYSVEVGAGATTSIRFESRTWEQPTPETPTLDGLQAILIGDSTGAGVGLQPMVAGMAAFKPGVLVHLGDFQYAYAITDTWTGLFKMLSPVLDRAVMLPTFGNHEDDGSATEASDYYDRLFSVAEGGADNWPRYYRTTVGEVEWIALDSQADEAGIQSQISWLTGVLGSPDPKARFRVVYLHQPIWTLSNHGQWKQDVFHPMFRDAGIKIVFSGHNHIYERFSVDGMTYIVSGGAGAELYPQDEEKLTDPAYQPTRNGLVEFAVKYHYITMTGKPDAVDFAAKLADGTSVDTFSIPLP